MRIFLSSVPRILVVLLAPPAIAFFGALLALALDGIVARRPLGLLARLPVVVPDVMRTITYIYNAIIIRIVIANSIVANSILNQIKITATASVMRMRVTEVLYFTVARRLRGVDPITMSFRHAA